MTLASRALRAFAPLLLIAPLPLSAQQAATAPVSVPAVQPSAAPRYAQPDDPWIYRGTDIPVDREWLFGELPNGLRYAVRNNRVPPGQVSIRVRIDAGSLHEQESERGFAHLIEHLTFRQSKYLADGEAIPHFQRLGASLGNDTNAITSPTQTVYKLDLPNARDATLEESIRLFSGMIREPALSAANLAAEVPIVLAERRERNGPDRRIIEATNEVYFAGQRLANRFPIGTVETLQGATSRSVKAFHHRWYRPENTVIVIAGDADPARLAALIEQYFGDWEVSGRRAPEPDFGDPATPRNADRANPVGETRVLVEPGQPRQLSFAVLRPWQQVTDNIEYNRGLLLDAVAETIINRRLETRAREGGSFLFASVGRQKTSRSADGTYVDVTPLGEDWRTALADVRAVIADAVATPPTQDEIDREVAQFDLVFANDVEQRRIQAMSDLADTVVGAVDIREAIAAPETILEVFRGMKNRFTPDEIHQHTREMFEGQVVRAVLLTPEAGEASAADLRQAMLAPVDGNGGVRASAEAIDFADLPPIGEPQAPVSRAPLGIFQGGDVEQLAFANGVRALIWPTENEPGRATVRVRFGSGLQGFADDEAAYIQLGKAALFSSGIGPLGQNELDRLATGRKLGLSFRVEEGTFVFEGLTRASDVADQIYLFAAKLGMPRWDAAPVERAKATLLLAYDTYGGDPNGVISRDLDWLLRDRDPRFATPTPDALRQTTAEGFKQVWSRMLAQGPIEVDVFGDIDRETVVAALSRTFGALPAREPAPLEMRARRTVFPAATATPVVLNHRGDPDQAAAVIAWPAGAGSAGLPQRRKLDLLAQIFSNRLLDAMRERAGASYSPYVGSNWPLDTDSGGNILALAQLPPNQVPAFFSAAEEIAADLAATGPTADEIARVTEPMLQLLNRAQTGHGFWLQQLEGSTFDRNRLIFLRTLMSDYTQVTTEEMRAIAARYLGAQRGWRLAVLPQAGASSSIGR
jgi:zinc protease